MEIKLIKENVKKLDATPLPDILRVLAEFPLSHANCFAEIIDNSFDNFKKSAAKKGSVEIQLIEDNLVFTDNGTGMNATELGEAVKAGSSDKSKHDDLGLFGVGFNIATSKLGDITTIYTKRAKDSHWNMATLDINKFIKKGDYDYQCDQVELPKISRTSGTIIEIQLKDDLKNQFARTTYQNILRNELGEIYTYLLRTEVPGLKGEVVSGKTDINIILQGVEVEARLPCIWSQSRTIKSPSPVIYIDHALPDLKICGDCGKWQATHETNCTKCGSNNLSVQERRIWGWLGLQRYLHTEHFGVTFIRNGRAIEINNKEVFIWKDPNGSYKESEYPVEQPANKGRFVGEIHCSHCKVSPSKDKFERNDPAFQSIIEIIRGSNPLKPKTRPGTINNSYLNKLFKAFRRNDPGEKTLFTGNGSKGTEEQARNWAEKFYDGDPDYFSDSKWYESAVNHDKIVASQKKPQAPIPKPIPGPITPTTPTTPTTPPVKTKATMSQKQTSWETGGTERMDLNFTFTLAGKVWKIRAFHTPCILKDDKDIERQVIANPGSGNELRVYVNTGSELIVKYGRSPTDLLLMELAAYIYDTLSKKSEKILIEIYEELLKKLPDEEFSQIKLTSKIEALLKEIRGKSGAIIITSPAKFFKVLSKDSINDGILNHTSHSPKTNWDEHEKDGTFCQFLSLKGFSDLVDTLPDHFFENNLFTPSWGKSTIAQDRIKKPIVQQLSMLDSLQKSSSWSDYEKNQVKASLANLHELLA